MARDQQSIDKTKSVHASGQPGVGDVSVPSIVRLVAKRTKAYQSKLYSLMAGRFTAEELDAMRKKARAHAGGKTKADLRAAKTAAEIVTGEFDIEGEPNTNLWIGLKVPASVAAQLAIPDYGEMPEDLHLTLAFMGDAGDYSTLDLAKMLVSIEDCVRWAAPLSGVVSGVGRFDNDDPVDPIDVIYASVDAPGLSGLREQIVNRLSGSNIQLDTTHGFDPHVTLAYVAEQFPTPALELGGIPIRFDSVCVYIGDTETEIALGGSSPGPCCGTCCSDSGQHELAELCSERHKARLFIEYEFKEKLPEWIPYLPKPGRYVSPRYGEILITKERNANFVKNFSAAIYQEKLPLDAEHELSLSGACGWLIKMRQNTDGSVDAKTEWTPRGKKLVEAGQFKYISPAFFDEWTDPATETKHSDVAYGAALTTRPFFKEKSLRPLLASAKGLSEGVIDGEVFKFTQLENYSSGSAYTGSATGEITTGEESMANKTAEQIAAEKKMAEAATAKDPDGDGDDDTTAAGDTDNSHFDKDGKKKDGMFDKDGKPLAKKASEAAGEKKFTEADIEAAKAAGAKEAVEAKTKELSEAQQANKELSDRVAGLEKNGRAMRFTEQAKEFAGNRDDHIEMMEFLATQGGGEDGDRFKKYVQQQKALTEQARAGKLFNSIGSDSTDAAPTAMASIEAKAKKMSEESAGKLTYEAALGRVAESEPELYREYVAEMRGGR